MARELFVIDGSVPAGSNFGGLFLLCAVVASVSMISMVIFACGDSTSGKRRSGGGGGGGGGGGDGGGGCGDGGGGGGGGGGC
ncbi:hypothetical protein Pint_19559 [Pistacia integerrima]|uniref:Uncharacterized protein n=1 Tax=Pistacia integerrima TaxID=434235 RepID=A0ACC0XB39_9ROSI|nr:hypothetical protein Pint_19559 [Pistacia integerrima]